MILNDGRVYILSYQVVIDFPRYRGILGAGVECAVSDPAQCGFCDQLNFW